MPESQADNQNIKFNICNINPEPIGLFTLPEAKHLKYKKYIQSIWEDSREEEIQQTKAEPHTRHICNKSNQNLFISYPHLKELKTDIQLMAIKYIQSIGYQCDEIIVNSAWLNKANKNAVLADHYHTNSYISGNYFVNFDSSKHSFLTFKNDRNSSVNNTSSPTLTCPEIDKKTIYTAISIGVKAKEGQIALWRSHLMHGYSNPNIGDNRITLSFNSMPKVLNDGIYSFSISD